MRGLGFQLSKVLLVAIAVSYPFCSYANSEQLNATDVPNLQSTSWISRVSEAYRIQKCISEIESFLVTYTLDKNLTSLTIKLNDQLQIDMKETTELLRSFNMQSSSFDESETKLLNVSAEIVAQANLAVQVVSADQLLPYVVQVTLANEYPADCSSESSLSPTQTLMYKLNQGHVYFNMGLAQLDFRLSKMNKKLSSLKEKQKADPKNWGLTRV